MEKEMIKSRFQVNVLATIAAVSILGCTAIAGSLPLVNGSFESPQTTFATPTIDGWVTDGPILDPQFGFNPFTGVFLNTAPAEPDHITNVDQDQIAFIGTQTGNEIVQVISGTPFQPGEYTLTAGVAISLGASPAATDALRLALFYEDDAGARQIVASTDILNDAATGLSANLLKTFDTSAVLDLSSPAIGRDVGVLITTIGQPDGFFDIDAVSVSFIPEPTSLALMTLAGLMGLKRRSVTLKA